ncbi:MAG: LytTR family DNA-binding domain-containing protein [Clostridiales bacterium]|nr:LytTR family DNA-binding domain-containing protein [Clostridiales bacterium]
MVIVAICDDETKIGVELEHALIDIFGKQNIKYEIDVFFTAAELYSKMEAGAHYDLIFLDICFGGTEMNGIEVGRLIREVRHNDTVSIVYMSWWGSQHAMELFDIRPLKLLEKPLGNEEIEQVISTYLRIAELGSKEFVYTKGRNIIKVRLKDILYLESNKKKLILYLVDGRTEEFYGALKTAYHEQLKRQDFLFIHVSYVVSYDVVCTMKYKELILTNGTILPISSHRRREVKEAYHAIAKRRRA